MNRDIEILRGVRYEKIAMESIENDIQWQRDRMVKCTSGGGDGMPRGGGGPVGMQEAFAELEALEAKQVELLLSYVERRMEAERILAGIDDERIRLFVRLYYVDDENVHNVCRSCKWSLRKLRDIQASIVRAEDMSKINRNIT